VDNEKNLIMVATWCCHEKLFGLGYTGLMTEDFDGGEYVLYLKIQGYGKAGI
jgi:hypothetical protein